MSSRTGSGNGEGSGMKRAWMGIAAGWLAIVGAVIPAAGQSSQQPFPVVLEKQLAERASNYTEVSLNRKMLVFASRFMNDKDDAEGKRIVSKLNGVYVRTFGLDNPGHYTAADMY